MIELIRQAKVEDEVKFNEMQGQINQLVRELNVSRRNYQNQYIKAKQLEDERNTNQMSPDFIQNMLKIQAEQ